MSCGHPTGQATSWKTNFRNYSRYSLSVLLNIIQHEQYIFSFQAHVSTVFVPLKVTPHHAQVSCNGDLGWGDPTYKVTWHINHVVAWQIKNVISSLSEGLWTPNLAGWWLRMRRLHQQSHVILWHRGHVAIKKTYLQFHNAHGPQT